MVDLLGHAAAQPADPLMPYRAQRDAYIETYRVEGRIDLLEILDVISNRLLLVSNFIQAPVYALGQAAKLLFCKPPFFASKLRWIESRTSFNAAVIRSPGGFRGPPWSSLRMPRTAVQ